MRYIIIKASHFLPKENIHIIVNTDSTDYYKFKAGDETMKIPMLGIIKFDDGFGKIVKQ